METGLETVVEKLEALDLGQDLSLRYCMPSKLQFSSLICKFIVSIFHLSLAVSIKFPHII